MFIHLIAKQEVLHGWFINSNQIYDNINNYEDKDNDADGSAADADGHRCNGTK